MNKQELKRKENLTEQEFRKQKKPKFDQKFDPSRKNKKYYLQKSYENF